MSFGFKNFLKGLRLVPVSTTAVSVKGDLEVLDSSGKLNFFNGTSASPLVSEAHSATLTNKILDADSNTISNIDDNEIKVAANIQISKLLAASNNHVIISSGTGVLTSEATLAKSRGGSGQDNSSITFPASGVLVTEAGTQTLTNKTIDASSNTITNLTNTSIAAAGSANIDRNKLASGTNYRILANNASGVMSENAAITAAHVVFADANGQLSGEATLSKSRGGSGQDNSSITFPASGTLTTNAGVQTLSNKSFSDPITLAEVATPSTPSSGNGKIYFKSDGFLYQLNDDGTETKVGAGSGGINYITNSDAESNVSGWAAYADAAGAVPVDGTGGSPTVTITRSTSSPLRGTGSFLLTKDAADRQGQGVSYDFTIADGDLAKPLSISFNYSIASGTFVAGDSSDLRVYLYDVTNAQVIQPAPYTIQGGTGSNHRFLSTFQTASNSNSYRLIVHVATTSASAYTYKFDDVQVGPQSLNYGSPVTDWTAYTPTFVGLGTVTSLLGSMWRRVGDSVQIMGRVTLGTTTGSTASISLPNGLVSASSLSTQMSGVWSNNSDSTNRTRTLIITPTSTSVNFSAANSVNTDIGTGVGSSGQIIHWISDPIPVAGWSSTVEMSNDTDTRVVAARAEHSSTTVNTGTPIVIFPTVTYDTHSSYNSSTGHFTAPVSGYYQVKTSIRFNNSAYAAGNIIELYIYKNGSQASILDRVVNAAITGSYMVDGSDTIKLVAGDIIDIRAYNDQTVALSGGNGNYISIERVSGPSAIAASEIVVARYNSANTDTIINNSDTIVDFGDRVIDTHSAVTTGASWKFTAPISAIYEVSSLVESANGAGWNTNERWGVRLYKNGSAYSYLGIQYHEGATSANAISGGSDVISLLAGDYIDIRIDQNSGANIGTGNNPAVKYVSIRKIK